MGVLEKENLVEIIDFMKENGVINIKFDDEEITLSENSLARYEHEKRQREMLDTPEEPQEKNKQKKPKDELRDFVYGGTETTKEERGAIYGF